MNIVPMAKLAGQAFAALASVREFKKAKEDHDRLRMAQAAVTGLSVGLTIAIVVRELKQVRANKPSRTVDLEENE